MDQREKGSRYETLAARYLEQQGFRVLERNFYARGGELDLIARDEAGILVFCEVKYRSREDYGGPLAAVGRVKRRRILNTALHYLRTRQIPQDTVCRFDVIGIHGDGRIEHIPNAFDFSGR